jgi:hypothetical protein
LIALMPRLALSVRALVTPPVVWNARTSSSQRVQGAHEPPALGCVYGGGPGVDDGEHLARLVDVLGAEQAADEFLELPRGGDLPVGNAGA